MKHGKILGVGPVGWNRKAAENAVDQQGNVNWRAAFAADPGVMKCPGCECFVWTESALIACPDCDELIYRNPKDAAASVEQRIATLEARVRELAGLATELSKFSNDLRESYLGSKQRPTDRMDKANWDRGVELSERARELLARLEGGDERRDGE